jgi:hypothetical protein
VKSEGENKRERAVGKAAGDGCVFIPGEGPRLADGGRARAMSDAAGGEGSHGAAKPEGVVHRCALKPNSHLGQVCGACSIE